MSNQYSPFEKKSQQKLFLPALCFAVFAAAVIDVMLPLLLRNIAETFQVPVGTASITASISILAGVAIGFLMAVLSVRFRHKLLLLIGILCISVAASGSFLAPTLPFLQVVYSLNGVGSVMIGAMALVLIGEFYPLEKRGKAVGWTVAAGFLAFTVGAPITALLANSGGWRSVMLWFSLPVSIASLIFAMLVLPSKPSESQTQAGIAIFAGYRRTLSNKSATACLLGTFFAAGASAVTTFVISFWMTQFSMSTSVGAIITMVNATSAAIGGIAAGRLVNLAGRKTTGVVAGFFASILVFLTFYSPTLEFSWIVSFARVWCYGMLASALASLTLEQVPEFRGSMMSLRGAFGGLGAFLGIAGGGIILNLYKYQAVGVFLGVLSFASIAVILLFADDPHLSRVKNSK